jgi:hypothetical protein
VGGGLEAVRDRPVELGQERPPGSATKASARSSSPALRLRMSSTENISTPRWCTSSSMKRLRITPCTRPPAASAASGSAPISPVRPPPYTSSWPRRAISAPSARAISS